MAFDIIGAKNAGYSDTEIADYLSQQTGFDAAGARKAGYSDQEIIGHVSGSVDVGADKPAQAPKSSLLRRAVGDTAISALKGAIALPESVVGLADIVTGGMVGQAAEKVGYRPKEAKAILDTMYSPEQQEANANVQVAKGFVPTVKAAVENPSTIFHSAVESAPSMIGGAGIARGGMKLLPKLAPVVAGAMGEGAMSAGQTAEQVRQESPDGRLTATQSAIAAGSGALTGGLGIIGGKVAQRLGITDIDTFLASGAPIATKKNLLKSVFEGVISEGALEELPQSAQEQAAQNTAQGKPWDEGVAEAAASGMIVGGVMGGGGNVIGHGMAPAPQPVPSGPLSRAVSRAAAPVQGIGALISERRGMAAPTAQTVAPVETPVQTVAPVAEAQPQPAPVTLTQEPFVPRGAVVPEQPQPAQTFAPGEQTAMNNDATQDLVWAADANTGKYGFFHPDEIAKGLAVPKGAAPVVAPTVNAEPTAVNTLEAPIQGATNETANEVGQDERQYADGQEANADGETAQGDAAAGVQAMQRPAASEGEGSVAANVPESQQKTDSQIPAVAGLSEAGDSQVSPEKGSDSPVPRTRQDLVKRYSKGNPFAEKAAAARYAYDQIAVQSGRDTAMANAFPLGAGFGRKGDAKRIDSSVNKATKAVELLKEAEWQEARAIAFDKGEINAQGRKPAKNADADAERRLSLKERERAAVEERKGKEYWEVRGTTIADSARQFGGNGRKFVIAEHRDRVEQALVEGKTVPPEVLADYPDLAPPVQETPHEAPPAEVVPPTQQTAAADEGPSRGILQTLAKPKKKSDASIANLAAQHGRDAVNAMVTSGYIAFPGRGMAELTKKGRAWLESNPAPLSPLETKQLATLAKNKKRSTVQEAKYQELSARQGKMAAAEQAVVAPQSKKPISTQVKTTAAEATALKDVDALIGQDGGDGLPTREEIRAAFADEPTTPEQPKAATTVQPKIDDFGEKIGGARKDYAAKFESAKTLDVATEPFAKTWPEPDYNKMIADGTDHSRVSLVRALRDEIPDKPRKSWKLKSWVAMVENLRDHAERSLAGDSPVIYKTLEKMEDTNSAAANIRGRVELYEAVGHGVSLKGITLKRNHWALWHGEKDVTKWQVEREQKATAFGNMPQDLGTGDTKAEAIEKFKSNLDKLQPSPAKATTFVIYSKNGQSGYFIGKKIGRDYVDLKTFNTVPEARTYLKEHQADLEAQLEKIKTVPYERRQENAPRKGKDARGGKDATPEMFQKAYGFRGVEFGNYLNAADRQRNLNEAFDALHDLAEIVGVPTKALSLNGELGLAFGARGHGGKNAPKAHYESGKIAINLTKNNGAGSLAHEWFHALDSYFSRKRGYPNEFITNKTVKYGPQDATRQELVDAFKNLKKVLDTTNLKERSRNLDKTRTKDYWSTGIEMHARAFENYVIDKLAEGAKSNDYLANIKDVSEYANDLLQGFFDGKTVKDLYPYLMEEEKSAVSDAFDNLFSVMQHAETEKGVALYSTAESSTQPLTLARVQSSFPTLPVTEDNGVFTVTTPSGVPIRISKVGEIEFDRKAAEEAYGREIGPHEAPVAEFRPLDHGALINLTERGVSELDHETFHAAMALSLNAKQRAAVLKKFGSEEKAAAEYQRLKDTGAFEEKKGHLFLNAIYRFFRNLRQLISPTAHGVMQDVASGKVWGKAHAADGGTKYAAADQTNTPAFKKWFGDSNVVDKEGRPLVVYHGTADEFNAFKVGPNTKAGHGQQMPGIYFSQFKGTAEAYARTAANWKGQWDEKGHPAGMRVLDAYVSLKKPKVYHNLEDFQSADRTSLEAKGFDGAIRYSDAGDMVEIVAFHPTQIKSASGNNGGFDPSNPDIRYSLKSAFDRHSPTELKAALTLHPKVQSLVAAAFDNGRNVTGWQKTVGTMYHLAEKLAAKGKPQFKEVFNKGQEFLNDISAFAVAAESLAPDIFPKLGTGKGIFHNLPRKDAVAIAEPLYQGTLFGGADPTHGKVFSDTELRRIFKLTDQQIDLYRQARAATDQSLDDMARSLIAKNAKQAKVDYDREMSLVEMAQDVKDSIQSKVDDMQAALDQAEKDFEEASKTLEGKELKDAQKQHLKFTHPQEAAIDLYKSLIQNIDNLSHKTETLKKRGYFPLMRFGEYTVTMKDRNGETQFFGMYESAYKAKLIESALREQHPNNTVVQSVMSKESFKLYGGMNLEALQLFAEHLGADETAAYQEYLKVGMANRSAMKRLIHRKGTAGYSEDAVRTLANFIVSNARHASTQYNLHDMRKLAAEIPEDTQGDVKDQAVKLFEYLTKPVEEAAKLRGYLFFHYLGGSLSAGIVNMTQPVMMTAPYLATKANPAKVAKHLAKASKMAFTDPAKIAGSLGTALRRAEKDGVTAPQEIHQLTAIASNKLLASNTVVNAAMKAWGGFFSVAEAFNRRVTFIASYRISRENGMSDHAAYQEAINAVTATQGIYNKCVDRQTEILTKDGWKQYNEISKGDGVYSVGANGELTEDVLQDVHIYRGEVEVSRMSAIGLDIVSTDNHDHMVQSYNSRDKKWQRLRKVATSQLKPSHHLLRVPLSDATGRVPTYTDDEVMLFAWVAAEGHFFAHRGVKEKRGVALVQSQHHNPQYVEEIDALLARLGGHFNRKTGRGGEMVCWQLRKPLWEKIHKAIPGKLLNYELTSALTIPQMALFLDTFTKADGHFMKTGGEAITQKSLINLNVLQSMAALCGRSSTLYEKMGEHNFGTLYLCKNSVRAHSRALKKDRITVDMVWCPQTANGTWIARRNGRTFVTGNSNRPNWGRGIIGAPLYTFKQFGVMYLELFNRLPAKQKALMMGILWLMAGLQGLPFAEDAEDIIDTIGQWGGYATNSKHWLDRTAKDALGDKAGSFLTGGVSSVLPIDIQGRMGMHNLIPGTGFLKQSSTDKGRDIREFFGPMGGLFASLSDALALSATGQPGRAALAASPRAIQNIAQGAEMLATGAGHDKYGRKTMEVSPQEAVAKMTGFNPSRIAEESQIKSANMQDVALFRVRKQEIVNQWAYGIANRDFGEVSAARRKLKDWREKNPDMPMTGVLESARRKAKSMKMTGKERFVKSMPAALRGRLLNEME